MFSGHGTRAPEQSRAEQRRGGKSAEFALATERFLDPQTGLALLICRARRRTHGTTRTSRTSRDAYAKRDNAKTSNSELEFPVGEPSVLHPQPPTDSQPHGKQHMKQEQAYPH